MRTSTLCDGTTERRWWVQTAPFARGIPLGAGREKRQRFVKRTRLATVTPPQRGPAQPVNEGGNAEPFRPLGWRFLLFF
ncbi:hypothetical protein JOE21_001346 [Desmospora profundinema]|uniref:Uncharacterized protein n=1 Tax=Desmospora profundinema TaxID=1571184 RepID=A0ABU1ILQ6_9BACL|nr:hypothetical protein [Desmospora profundinema]